MNNMIGLHVNWTKISGKPDASMVETKGFGSLYRMEVGSNMIISGDYGVTTTMVKSIEMGDGIATVTTKNSVYLVEDWR